MNPQAPATPPAPASGTVQDGSVVENALLGGGRQVGPLTATAERIYDKLTAADPATPPAAPPKEGAKPNEPAQPAENPTPPKETPAPQPPAADPAASADPGAAADPAGAEEPVGYFADDGLDDDQPASATSQAPVQQPAQEDKRFAGFSPVEAYVAQNIGQPIQVRIKDGEGTKVVQAYNPENLPENFEYASDKDRTTAQLGFDAMTRKAEQLKYQFEQSQMQQQQQSFQEQEDTAIQRDIGALQRAKAGGKDGLDTFKYQPDDPRFDNDPAVKEMQEVLNFYNKENKARFAANDRLIADAQRRGLPVNNVRLNPTITFRDAFKVWRADNPTVGPEQQAEDEQRRVITKPLAKAGKSSGDAPRQQRPKLPRNATVDQIARAYGL